MPLWDDKPEAWHEIQPGVQRRILAHDSTVMMVLQGGGLFEVGSETWTLKVGSSYTIPGGVAHELRADAKTPTIVLDVFTPRREEFLHETVRPDRA